MPRPSGLALALLCGCGSPATTSGFGPGGPGGGEDADTSTGAAGSSTSSSSTGAAEASTTSGSGEGSAAHDDSSAGTTMPDFGEITGCQGKIDFLFVISNDTTMKPVAAKLKAALPAFIKTIRESFAQFDNHIMVVDTDQPYWGSSKCQSCVETCDYGPPEYPCSADLEKDAIKECDHVVGAGVTFPAGWDTANERCKVFGDNRYMIRDDPTPDETFQCLAGVGHDGAGYGATMVQAIAALAPEINAPGGCNAGFLRPEALLVLVLIRDTYEPKGGPPQTWVDAILAAKGGNPDAVVTLGITTDWGFEKSLCFPGKWPPPEGNTDLLREFVGLMTHGLVGSICAESWAPFFDEAAELVLEQCDLLIPQ